LTELTGIGAELRRARESQGLTLADVAQQLKFAPHQIDFLENERFDRLPGPTIARGMVRNYARLLNLEPESMVARMSPKVPPVSDATLQGPALKQPVPFSDGGGRSTWIYAAFSLAVLALAAVLGYGWQQERAGAPQFVAPAEPQRPAEPEPPPVERLADPAPPPVVAEAPKPEPKPEPKIPKPEPKIPKPEPKIPKPEPKIPKPEPKTAIEKPAPPQAAATPPIQAATAPQAPADTQPREATGNVRRIVLICEEDSWLEVRDGTGRSVVQSLYPAGSERVVRGRGPFEIVIGNARAVRLVVDDKPVDLKRHTRGEVARVVIQ
jgi:cytoskeleton protein RodZ